MQPQRHRGTEVKGVEEAEEAEDEKKVIGPSS
jgi:hypothetical protein